MVLELVSQFLGHSKLETSRIYAFGGTIMKRIVILKAKKILTPNADEIKAQWQDGGAMIFL